MTNTKKYIAIAAALLFSFGIFATNSQAEHNHSKSDKATCCDTAKTKDCCTTKEGCCDTTTKQCCDTKSTSGDKNKDCCASGKECCDDSQSGISAKSFITILTGLFK